MSFYVNKCSVKFEFKFVKIYPGLIEFKFVKNNEIFNVFVNQFI